MSEQSEPRVPFIRIELELEGGVRFQVVDAAPADAERVVEWMNADVLRRLLVGLAFALGQPRKDDLPAGDDVLVSLAAALECIPAVAAASSSVADPLDAIAPAGSLQGQTLRYALAQGEPGRRWISWAAAQPWLLDPEFRSAVREVAGAEGLLEAPDASAEDDAPPAGSDKDGNGG